MIAAGFAAAAVFAVVLAVAVWAHERALKRAEGPAPNVVAFEMAGTGAASHQILSGIGPTGRSAVRRAIGIDTWIILGYAPGLAVLALLSTNVIDWASDGTVEAVGTAVAIAMAIAALVAGALDLKENAALITILDLWSDAPIAPTDQGAARAAIEQQHRRDLIARFERPSAAAKRAAVPKFLLVGIVLVGWGLTILCVAVTNSAS